MANIFNFTDLWNNAGTVFNAIKCNITNTASHADSKLIDMQVDSTSKFSVGKDGLVSPPSLTTGIITEFGAARTLAAVDANKLHRFLAAGGCTVTIPLEATESIPIGAKYPLRQAAGISSDGFVKLVLEGGVILNLPRGIRPPRVMRAMAILSADQTDADYSVGAVVPWDGANEYDTDDFHDPASNNSRMTIPTGLGIRGVRLNGAVYLTAIATSQLVASQVWKNGSSVPQSSRIITEISAIVGGGIIASAVMDCVGGDYFEYEIDVESDTTVTVNKPFSNFALEVVEIDAQGTSAGPDTEFWVQKVDTDEWDIGGMFM